MRIGLVDQAVLPLDRWNRKNHAGILRKLRSLTEIAERDGAELTIWPEAAYPYPLAHEHPRVDDGRGKAIVGDGVKGPVLFGLITQAGVDDLGARNSYNSTALIMPEGAVSEPSDKIELLWFGETVPGSDWFPWLRRTFQQSGALLPGSEPRGVTLDRAGGGPLRMGILNCYEDTLSGVGRKVTRTLSPNLLVNVTNDAWFYDTAESDLHARLGAMRAVETRHDLVRAVNLGVMSWVDATGAVRARWAESRAHAIVVTPAIDDGAATFFVRFGDAPALILMIGLAAFFWRRGRTRDVSSG
jgi:apolipoprotein N-acyltransferase